MANWFIALPVEDAEWRRALRKEGPDARWTHPADLHLTLAFLGAVGEQSAHAAWDALGALPPPPRAAQLGRLKRFGRALAAEVEAPELVEWMGAHREALLAAAGAKPDPRAPRPHLSVARPRRGEALFRWAAGYELPRVALDLAPPALFTRSDRPAPRYVAVERATDRPVR